MPEAPGDVHAEAPIAAGHGALPLPGEPTALGDRPLEGLYAAPPSADTLQQLAQAPLSPDGRYRALFSGGEAWVARVDGAWIWQVQLPAAQPPQLEPPPPAGTQPPPAAPPTPPVAATVAAPLQWTPQSRLLFRDSTGIWQEANPNTAIVAPLPAAFLGATGLIPSPDGQSVLYYRGTQLFTAKRDGSQPQLVGDNLVGHWDSAGQLVTTQLGGAKGTSNQ